MLTDRVHQKRCRIFCCTDFGNKQRITSRCILITDTSEIIDINIRSITFNRWSSQSPQFHHLCNGTAARITASPIRMLFQPGIDIHRQRIFLFTAGCYFFDRYSILPCHHHLSSFPAKNRGPVTYTILFSYNRRHLFMKCLFSDRTKITIRIQNTDFIFNLNCYNCALFICLRKILHQPAKSSSICFNSFITERRNTVKRFSKAVTNPEETGI